MTALAEWAARPARAAPINPAAPAPTVLLRNCATCGTCFEAHRPTALYCTTACRDEAAATRRADRRQATRAGSPGGTHACPDCGAQFSTGNALGGHRTKVHVRPAPSTRARLARAVHNSHPCADCGQPCSSQSMLDAHRGRHHRAKGTIPPTVRVLASMTFTCEHCGAEYQDSNRLAHHRRELHDPPHRPAHEVAVTRPLLAWAIA